MNDVLTFDPDLEPEHRTNRAPGALAGSIRRQYDGTVAVTESAIHTETAIVTAVRFAPFRKRVAFFIGQVLSLILPGRAKSVESGDLIGSTRLVDRILRNGIRARAITQCDHRRIRDMHRAYWETQANEFATDYAFRFKEQFLASDASFLVNVDETIESMPIESIVELGCGNGLVLHYLSNRWPSVKNLVGIDIDADVICRNHDANDNKKLMFVHSDVFEWTRQHARPSTLLITNGGVLEYFLRSEVEELFRMWRSVNPTAIVLIETIGSDHDLEHDTDTHVYGRELSFSHNYSHLLERAGFEIQTQNERLGPHGDRWIRVAAIA